MRCDKSRHFIPGATTYCLSQMFLGRKAAAFVAVSDELPRSIAAMELAKARKKVRLIIRRTRSGYERAAARAL
jgi:hypothetical protein